MEYIIFTLCLIACAVIGFVIGRDNGKLPRNKVLIDYDTFEYLRERDDELWEIERAERMRRYNGTVIIAMKEDKLTAVSAE
jgi:hypothetical protein